MVIIKRKFDSLIHDSTVVKKIGTRMKLSNLPFNSQCFLNLDNMKSTS